MTQPHPHFTLPQEASGVPANLSGPAGAPASPGGAPETAVPFQTGGGGAPPASPWTGMLLPIALVFFFMWFFVMRPERKRQKERTAMLSRIKKGDRVVTVGGMHGEVVRLEETTIVLKVDEGVRLKFDRSAVTRIPSAGQETPAPAGA